MRRFVSFVLAAALVIASAIPAAATSYPQDEVIVSYKPYIGYIGGSSVSRDWSVATTYSALDRFPLLLSSDYTYPLKLVSSSATWLYCRYTSASSSSVMISAGSAVRFIIPAQSIIRIANRDSDGVVINNFVASYYCRVVFYGTGSTVIYTSDTYSFNNTSSNEFLIDSDVITDDVRRISIDFCVPFASNNFPEMRPGTGRIGVDFDAVTVKSFPVPVYDLLSSILSFLQSILSFLTNIVDAILSIPQTIIDLLSDLLKFLFIPTEEDLSSIIDDFSSNFKEKLGFLWECSEVVVDFWSNLTASSETSTIDFPGLSIAFPGGTFTLPAQAVPIWPSGISALQAPVRLGTTIVLVFLWLRGLLHRVEQILNPGGD